jgi:hypothetical protein
MAQILVIATTTERGRIAVRSAAARAVRERACLTLAICAPARPWWQHLSWARGDVPEPWETEPITAFTWRDMVALVPEDVSLTVREMSGTGVAVARRLAGVADYDLIVVEESSNGALRRLVRLAGTPVAVRPRAERWRSCRSRWRAGGRPRGWFPR